ncbi:hypothetical protein [Tepidimonas charontis]|nr:hypothetical protein [Tepidimonas charontis]
MKRSLGGNGATDSGEKKPPVGLTDGFEFRGLLLGALSDLSAVGDA